MMRTIDPETNWFWREGYDDAISGRRAIVPDETRYDFQRSDYFAGYDAGQEERAAANTRQDLAHDRRYLRIVMREDNAANQK